MAQLSKPFNARMFQPFGGGSNQNLPLGEKQLCFVESVEVRSKAKSELEGGISLKLRIKDGPNQGLFGTMWLAMYDSNMTAVALAEQKLASICYCIGILDLGTNIDLILNKDFRIDVTPQKKDPTKTDVESFYGADGTPVHELARQYSQTNVTAAPQFNQAPVAQSAAPVATFNPQAAAPVAAPAEGTFSGQFAPASGQPFGQAPVAQPFGQAAAAPAAFPAQGQPQPFAQPAAAPQPSPGFAGSAWGGAGR